MKLLRVLLLGLIATLSLPAGATADNCRLYAGDDYLILEGSCVRDCLDEDGYGHEDLGDVGEVDPCPVGRTNIGTVWTPSGDSPGTICNNNQQCASGECSADCLYDTFNPANLKGCCSQKSGEDCLQPNNCQSMTCDRPNPPRPGKCRNNPTTGGDNRPDYSVCRNHRDCASGNCRSQSGGGRKCVP